MDAHQDRPLWPGLDLKHRATFLPYWDSAVANALATHHERVFASAYRQDNKLIIVLFNNAEDIARVTLTARPGELGVRAAAGKPFAITDAEQKETAVLDAKTEGATVTVSLPVKARDYRVVKLEP